MYLDLTGIRAAMAYNGDQERVDFDASTVLVCFM